MARKPRVEYPGALYHVITRGNNKDIIFHSEKDYQYYLDKLLTAKQGYDFSLYSYCLMPNHIHLLIQTGETPLSRIMASIQSLYAHYHNRRYKRVGHVFQGRYKAILCDADSYLLELIRYIHLNPVRVGLALHPRAYPWSSYKNYLEESEGIVDKNSVLPMFGKTLPKARAAFEHFVCAATCEGKRDDLYKTVDQRFLGDEEFVFDTSLKFDDLKRKRLAFKRRSKVSLEDILSSTAKVSGIDESDILSPDQSRDIALARHLFMYIAIQRFNYKTKEVADFLEKDISSASKGTKKIKGRVAFDRELSARIEKILECLAT